MKRLWTVRLAPDWAGLVCLQQQKLLIERNAGLYDDWQNLPSSASGHTSRLTALGTDLLWGNNLENIKFGLYEGRTLFVHDVQDSRAWLIPATAKEIKEEQKAHLWMEANYIKATTIESNDWDPLPVILACDVSCHTLYGNHTKIGWSPGIFDKLQLEIALALAVFKVFYISGCYSHALPYILASAVLHLHMCLPFKLAPLTSLHFYFLRCTVTKITYLKSNMYCSGTMRIARRKMVLWKYFVGGTNFSWPLGPYFLGLWYSVQQSSV